MLIGICGSMRAGKDTLARILKDLLENAGSEVEIYKFVTPMKKSVFKALITHTNLPLIYEDIDGETDFDREEKLFNRNQTEVIMRSALGLSELFYPVPFEDILEEDKTYSVRDILQIFGNEVVKGFCDKDYWKDLLTDYHEDNFGKIIIVPDVRFDDEFQMMDEMYWIRRDAAEDSNTSKHISEHGISDYTGARYVDNNGTVEELYNKMYKYLFT